MGDNEENVCCAAPTLIFACSGAADVGAIADRAARKLTANGAGKMYCLAGIGGRVAGILKTTEEAEKILAIDGCPLDCTKILPLSFKPRFLNLATELTSSSRKEERHEKTRHNIISTCIQYSILLPI